MLEIHKDTSRESLLELLGSHPQFSEWRDKSWKELRDILCDLQVTRMFSALHDTAKEDA